MSIEPSLPPGFVQDLDLATPRIQAMEGGGIGRITGPWERFVKYLKFDPLQVQALFELPVTWRCARPRGDLIF